MSKAENELITAIGDYFDCQKKIEALDKQIADVETGTMPNIEDRLHYP